VATDDNSPIGLQPLDNPPSNPAPILGVAWSARYASGTEELQSLPDVPRHKPAHDVEPVTLKIGLMPVNYKEPLPGSRVVQDQSLVSDDSVFLHPTVLATLDVVVAHDEVKPILPVKFVQQVKDTPMSLPDVTEPPVLPQFVAVSDLNIRESLTVIVG